MTFDLMSTVIAFATFGRPETMESAAPEAETTTTEPAPSWDDLERTTTVTQTAPAPAPAPETSPGPTPEELERRRLRMKARGLAIGGWTTFAVTWGAAVTIGVISIDLADEGDHLKRMWGRRMTIPIGGPFAAAFVTQSATGTLFTVLTGAAQIAGIGIGTAGAVMVARQKRAPNFAFAIVPDPNGAHMGATWRF